jgi:hypothetical protein
MGNKWALGRVILAGDAAYVWYPFGGQGIASGVRDASSFARRRNPPITTKSWPHGMLNANSRWRGHWQPQYRTVHMLQRAILGKCLCATGTCGLHSLSLAGNATLKGPSKRRHDTAPISAWYAIFASVWWRRLLPAVLLHWP